MPTSSFASRCVVKFPIVLSARAVRDFFGTPDWISRCRVSDFMSTWVQHRGQNLLNSDEWTSVACVDKDVVGGRASYKPVYGLDNVWIETFYSC